MKSLVRIKKAIGIFYYYYIKPDNSKLGSIGVNSNIARPADIKCPKNVYLGNNTKIGPKSTIMSVGTSKFVMKDNSNAAECLTVITSTHSPKPGSFFSGNDNNVYKDIIVEEGVEIGYNVTLLPGTHLGRGSMIGAGTVVRSEIPPYSIAIGNPAKIIGFVFTPEQIIEHEKQLYAEQDRLKEEVLLKNYEKYFINKMKEIRSFASNSL